MIDYDPNDAGPVNKAEMLNSSGAMRTPVWSDVLVRSNPAEMAKDAHLFIRVPTRGVYDGNLRLTDSGTCYVATTEVPFDLGDVGEVWVDYDITFHVPALNKSEPLSSYGRALGSDGQLLGDMQSDTAEKGSAASYITKTSNGHSVLEFLQDFTGTVLVDLYEDASLQGPPLMTVDTDFPGGQISPALIGFVDTIKDTVFGASKLAVGVVAKAGDGLRIKSAEGNPGWSLGQTVLRLLPYAKALMGALAAIVTKEQKIYFSLKANVAKAMRIEDRDMKNLAFRLANRTPATPVQVAVQQLVNSEEYNVNTLVVYLQTLETELASV